MQTGVLGSGSFGVVVRAVDETAVPKHEVIAFCNSFTTEGRNMVPKVPRSEGIDQAVNFVARREHVAVAGGHKAASEGRQDQSLPNICEAFPHASRLAFCSSNLSAALSSGGVDDSRNGAASWFSHDLPGSHSHPGPYTSKRYS